MLWKGHGQKQICEEEKNKYHKDRRVLDGRVQGTLGLGASAEASLGWVCPKPTHVDTGKLPCLLGVSGLGVCGAVPCRAPPGVAGVTELSKGGNMVKTQK